MSGIQQKEITLRILNWDQYIKRKDHKNFTWWSFSADTLLHPDFFGATGDHFKVFCWIISVSAKAKSDEIRVHLGHAAKILGVKESCVENAISFMQYKRWKIIDNNEICSRYELATNLPRTQEVRYITEHNITEQRESHLDGEAAAHPLIEIWNSECGTLPKVKKSNALRNKKASKVYKEHSHDEWVEIVRKIAKSKFCNGNSQRGWVATFDWILNPDTSLKVLDGKYDNREDNYQGADLTGVFNE